jgi:oligosaccharide repeat unit polymerase
MMAATTVFFIITFVYILLTTRTFRQWLIDPSIVFVFFQLMLFWGSLPFLDFEVRADVVHCIIMVVALGFFTIGASIVDMANPASQKNVRLWVLSPLQRIESNYSFNLLLGIIVTVSIIVGTAYFYAVGYNLFLESIVSFIKGENLSALAADLVTKRLESYSGERYFAPGYVNQFKNILLPLITLFLIAKYCLQKKRMDLLIVLGLVPLNVIFLLGTGQRGAFMRIMLILFVFINITMTSRKNLLANLIVLITSITLFAFTSFSLGRVTNEESTGQSVMAKLIMELPKRMLAGNQKAAVVGFRYVYDKDIQYGADWWSHMKEVLPGQGDKITLESENFQILSGSTRGTAPLSIWGQIWYNFGPVGVIVISFIMGLIYKWLYVRFLHKRKSLLNLLIHAAITVMIGTWVAGAPIVLFNTGLVTVILFKVLIYSWENFHKFTFQLTRVKSYGL